MLKELFTIFGTIGINNKDANKALDETTSKGKMTAKTLSKHVETIGKTFVSAGKLVTKTGKVCTTVTAGIVGGLATAVSRFDTLNNYPKVLSNLGFSAEDAKKSIDVLSQGIDGLPTTLDDAASGVQRLVAKNGDINKSTKYFLAMNDAIVAGNAPAEQQRSAIEQLTQAYSKGKFDLMEWRTLMMAMPGQLKQVATAMGFVNTDELYDALSKGKISMDKFMDAIVNLDEKGSEGILSFQEQARNSCDSIGTSVTNLANRVKKGFATILTNMNEAAGNTAFGSIAGMINSFSTAIKNFLDKIGGAVKENKAFNTFMNQIANAIAKLNDGVNGLSSEQLDKIVTAIVKMVKAGPVLLIVGKGFTILGNLINKCKGIVEKHRDSFINATTRMSQAVKNWKADIKTAFAIGGNYIKEGISNFKEMFENLKIVVTEVGKGFLNMAGTIASGIGKATSIVAKGVTGIVSTVGKGIADLVGSLTKELFAPVIDVFTKLKDKVVNTVTNLKNSITDKFNEVKSNVIERTTVIKDTVVNKFNELKDRVISKVNDIKEGIVNKFNELKDRVISKVNDIKEGIVNKFNEVKDSVINKVVDIKDNVVAKFAQLKDGAVGKFSSLKDEIGEKINNIAETVGNKFTKLKDTAVSKLNDIGAKIAEKFSPVTTVISNKLNTLQSIASTKFAELKNNVGNKVGELAGTLSSHFGSMSSNISSRFGEMASKISGPFSNALNKGKQGLGYLGKGIGTVGKGLGTAMKGVGILSVGLVGLASVASVSGTDIAAVAQKIVSGVQNFANNLPGIITQIVNQIQTTLPQIVAMIPQLISSVTQAFQTIVQALPQILPQLVQGIVALIQGLVTMLPTIIPLIVQAAVQLFTGIVQALPQILPPLIEGFIALVNSIVGMLPTLIPALIQGAIQLFLAIVDALPQIIPPLIDAIPIVIDAFINALPIMIPALVQGAVKLFMAIVQALPQIISQLVQEAPKIVKAIIDGIGQMLGELGNAAGKIGESIWNAIKELPQKALGWGKDMIQGMINGIKGMVGNIGNAVSGIGDKIRSFLHFSRPDEGPLREYETWMPDMIEGLSRTLKKSAPLLYKTTKNLAQKVSEGLDFAKIPENIKTTATGNAIWNYEGAISQPKAYSVVHAETQLGMSQFGEKDSSESYSYLLQRLIDILLAYFPQFAELMERDLIFEDGTVAARLTPLLDKNLANEETKRRRGN